MSRDESPSGGRLLEANHTALLLIDLQEKLVPHIHERERVLRNTSLLIRLARILGLPILLTTQYAEGLGGTVQEIRTLLPDVLPLDKPTFGCFSSDSFLQALRRLPSGIHTLVLAGIETHICVAQTALEALQNGYFVHVASDATSSRAEHNWRVGLNRMEKAGALISSTEMVIYELLGRSDSSQFKQMLPFLKEQG